MSAAGGGRRMPQRFPRRKGSPTVHKAQQWGSLHMLKPSSHLLPVPSSPAQSRTVARLGRIGPH